MADPRKNPEDIAEAAAALGILQGEDLEPDRLSMMLDAGQRQTILSSSRLDLARGILTKSATSVFEELGEDLDVSYHSFGRSPQVLSDANTVSAKELAGLKANESSTSAPAAPS